MSESSTTATGPDFSRGDGLVPAIAQDSQSGEVLMMAYMNAESYAETVATGRAVYFSRSRKKLWRKGEESGNVQTRQVDLRRLRSGHHPLEGRADRRGRLPRRLRQLLLPPRDPAKVFEVEGQRVFDPAKVYGKK